MTANQPLSSAAPDGLASRLARLGLPAAGAQDRQDALPGSLQAEAVVAAKRIFGGLLNPEPSRYPAKPSSTEQRRPTTCDS